MLLEDPQAIAHRYRRVLNLLLVLLLVAPSQPIHQSYAHASTTLRTDVRISRNSLANNPMNKYAKYNAKCYKTQLQRQWQR